MSEKLLDLRSDTVTRPTPGMRAAMAEADVGDDVFGEDPTVYALEERVAALLGKERAIFVPSGTMSNQIGAAPALLARRRIHLRGRLPHLQLRAGRLCPTERPGRATGGRRRGGPAARAARRPDSRRERSSACAPGCCAWRTPTIAAPAACCPMTRSPTFAIGLTAIGLATHLDGARLWNAAVATGIPPADWAQHFDTVSVCFSKGLGAPVGSALAGPRRLIKLARRHRKLLGGGMRQAGVMAAAALYALEHHVDRLAVDHAHAAQSGRGDCSHRGSGTVAGAGRDQHRHLSRRSAPGDRGGVLRRAEESRAARAADRPAARAGRHPSWTSTPTTCAGPAAIIEAAADRAACRRRRKATCR